MADRRRNVPRYNALVASAAVMTARPSALGRPTQSEAWQDEAWQFYDEIGELRFGIGWIANALSRVNLVAARQPAQLGDEPAAIETPDPDDLAAVPLTPVEQAAVDLVAGIAGGANGQGALLADLAIMLEVPGVGWVLIESETAQPPEMPMPELLAPDAEPPPAVPDETWTWSVLSNEELRTTEGVYEVMTADNEWRPLSPAHVLIKVWRAHPRRGWQPDSPTRAVLGTLRQIRLLDEHVMATAQSRLAGAGLLLLPTEIEFKPLVTRSTSPLDPTETTSDDFVETLIDTMTVPINDRESAAAVVPLTVRVPGEYIEKVRHVTFWTEFSGDVMELRENAIKRLALGLDMPPEVLTGMADVNHWTAWQVEETAITLHIEPLAEVVCDALTVGYLQPALEAAGHLLEAARFMVWSDSSDLTTRPDRSSDAVAAYDRLELTGAALRRESGLSEADAPDDDELAHRLRLKIVESNATLAPVVFPDLGLEEVPVSTAQKGSPPPAGAPGGPAPAEPGPPVPAASIVAACDALVYRALERAGSRLRSAIGRRQSGGSAAVEVDDLTRLHTRFSASSFANLDDLLAGSWTHVPITAEALGLDADDLTATLDSYTRALLATSHEHSCDRIAEALGVTVAG